MNKQGVVRPGVTPTVTEEQAALVKTAQPETRKKVKKAVIVQLEDDVRNRLAQIIR